MERVPHLTYFQPFPRERLVSLVLASGRSHSTPNHHGAFAEQAHATYEGNLRNYRAKGQCNDEAGSKPGT